MNVGQQEVYKLLKKKGRLATKEIADELHIRIQHASDIIKRMLNSDVAADLPTVEEVRRILAKYPSSKKGVYKLKVYFVNDGS